MMDAKPQRPRAVRVHDENMPPAAIGGVSFPGKSLHQRTKSTPSLSTLLHLGAAKAAAVATNKKVLGEVNANMRVTQAAKDDSEVGKASPGKIMLAEPAKPAATATLTRPATRPLAPKSTSTYNVPTAAAAAPVPVPAKAYSTEHVLQAQAEPVRRVGSKKSTKVLKDVQQTLQPEADVKKTTITAPVHQNLAAQKLSIQQIQQSNSASGVALQEVRRTESIPLREEPAALALAKPISAADSQHPRQGSLPAGFVSELEYLTFLEHNAAQAQLQHINSQLALQQHPQYLPAAQQLDPQLYEVDDDGYYYESGYTTRTSFGLRGESTGGVTTILAPEVTEAAQLELIEARIIVESSRPVEDIEDEQWDVSMVAEYGDEIFEYMRALETKMTPNPRYMDQQQEIQWPMRAVLMDWVIQVHGRFNLLPETLFLTVNYIDRFLSCKVVSLGKLQLVGATAIFVAAKYEEVQCPNIAEIIYMVDNGYDADELMKAERFMLSMLRFELGWPGPMSFLRRISKADDYDLETRTLAKYFLEVTIMDERFVGCTPSFLAAGAHCMARLMLRKGEWSQAHVYYSNYTYPQLRELLGAILDCCEQPQEHHKAVFEKYMDKRYKRASTFVAEQMAKGFSVPYTSGGNSGPIASAGVKLW